MVSRSLRAQNGQKLDWPVSLLRGRRAERSKAWRAGWPLLFMYKELFPLWCFQIPSCITFAMQIYHLRQTFDDPLIFIFISTFISVNIVLLFYNNINV